MLGRRLASATVIISVLIVCVILDVQLGRESMLGRPGLVLALISIALAMSSAHEIVTLLQQRNKTLASRPIVCISGLMISICCLPALWRSYPADCLVGFFGWSMLGLTVALGLAFLIEIFRYNGDSQATERLALSSLVFGHVLLLFSFLIAHRLFSFDNVVGMLALLTLLTTVKMSDAAAYFVGKTLGRTKLAPTLSPGKTIEGAVGSVVGAWMGTTLIVKGIAPYAFQHELNIPLWWIVVYGLAVTVAGIVGDLTESMFKRDAKIKDSSSWLPGLGGILDITDSLVLAAPISYFFWVLVR